MNARAPTDGLLAPAAGASAVLSAEQQLLLATWLSPGFPVGGFAYSHGLETAIAEGAIAQAADMERWAAALMRHGSGWSDALLLAEAWMAVGEGDGARLDAAVELAAAMASARERRLEALALGEAFLIAVEAGWPVDVTARLKARGGIAYPVAVGAAAAGHRLPLEPVLAGYLNAFAATLISVAVRLVPLGQTAGLATLSALQKLALATAREAATAGLDALGGAALKSDIAAMRHETLSTRIFRT